MQWFRLYSETLNDPKVQSLDGEAFKSWINLLCVASQCNATCNVTDVSFHLRCSPEQAASYVTQLVTAGLFHNDGGIISPHNWNKRQYKSDTSNERVKKFRQKKSNVSCNVTSPLPVTPPEQNRTDTKQKQIQKEKKGENFVLPLPEWLPLSDWNDYLASRKKKATNRAKQLLIIKLDELRSKGNDPSQVLMQSTMNGWTSLIEIKERKNENTTTGYRGIYSNSNQGTSYSKDRKREYEEAAVRGMLRAENPDF